MKKRKFLILFLDTGGGHKAAANVLKTMIQERYPGSEAIIVNGFSKKSRLPKLFFVDFYHIAMNFFSSLYSFVYRFGNNPLFVRVSHLLLQTYTIPHVRKIFEQEHPTDIINLHFALESPVRYMKREHPEINAVTIVLDPFTVHSSWFYDKKGMYFVFSERVCMYAVEKCGIPKQNIKVVPFILNQKFLIGIQNCEIDEIKLKFGISPQKKVVLLAGGGEGLPVVIKIVNEFIARKSEYTIIAVCGKNVSAMTYLNVLAKMDRTVDLKVFGFVDFMDELVRICPCGEKACCNVRFCLRTGAWKRSVRR